MFGARLHAARIAAVVGLGEAEAADQVATRKRRQVLVLLLARAVRVDGMHDERRLHAERRPIATIHSEMHFQNSVTT